ncbi:hypothetical protein M0638_13055 [Roseomonas sp. NAR14]|uniref:DUF3592 domain-containing protein n=1 Tax=Roseomonas acroporae TaxID=2937791 RepID=A0A9X1Y6Y6_9PROT|nr:DUF3592 domain-containing protein [Roseomonas acroporae]MCK8785314.1 hypothetical protein [Roseomonas acroporae]
MEKLLLALGGAAVAALAVLRFRALARWRRCDATYSGRPGDGPLRVTRTGQPLPIRFRLADGRPVEAALRHHDRGAAPEAGGTVRIIHDPDDPERVERPSILVAIAAIGAFAAVAMAWALLGWLRDLSGAG